MLSVSSLNALVATSGNLCQISLIVVLLTTVLNFNGHAATATFFFQADDAYDDSADLIITEEEAIALGKLRLVVAENLTEEFMNTDFYLIRWLRNEYEMDVDRAAKKVLETVQWREANNISQIRFEDFSEFERDFPIQLEGFDYAGRPVASFDFGAWDLRGAVYGGRQESLQRYLTYSLERGMYEVIRVRNETGYNVTQGLTLIDTGNMGLRQHFCSSCRTVLSEWINTMETYYPRFLKECIVVNAPRTVSLAMTILSPFMSSETKQKLKIFNWNKQTWSAYLDEKMDRAERTEKYGGVKASPAAFSKSVNAIVADAFNDYL